MSQNTTVLAALKQTSKGRLKYDAEWFSEPGIQVIILSPIITLALQVAVKGQVPTYK